MSSYGQEEMLGILWGVSGDKSRIVAQLAQSRAGTSKTFWGNYYDALMPLYQEAVKKKLYSAYVMGSSSGKALLSYLTDRTKLERNYVGDFLMTVQSLASAGEITIAAWNPAAGGEMKQDLPQEAAKTTLKAFKATAKAVGEASFAMWPVVIVVGVVGLIVFSPQIKAFLPKSK